jgi:hypothetical protein
MALTPEELQKIEDDAKANFFSGAREIRQGDRMLQMHEPEKVERILSRLEAEKAKASGVVRRRRVKTFTSSGL